MKVLVLNAGSSSIKYELFDMAEGSVLAAGLLERIGERERPVRNHRDAFACIGAALSESGEIRARACSRLAGLGIGVDPEKNERRSRAIREIQDDDSTVKVLVIPTDEELEIAEATVACLQTAGC